jgi:hypothetical protein
LETIGEVSNSQRHKASTLAGTQNPQHRSQPAKELAFCLAWVTVFRLTQLKLQHSIKDREKGERTTWGLALLGQDVVIFFFSNMAAVVRAGQTSVSILSYLVHQQSISSGSGRTFFKSPNNAKPCPLCVIIKRHTMILLQASENIKWTDSTGRIVGLLAFLVSIISTAIAIITFKTSQRRNKIDIRSSLIKTRQENYSQIRDWADTVIKTMTETSSLCEFDPTKMEEGLFFTKRIHLINDISYLIDKGRLYLPNDKPESHGTEKPWAYKGLTKPAITAIKEFLKATLELNYQDKTPNVTLQKKLNTIKREYVSHIQMTLEVREIEKEFIELLRHYKDEIERG